MTRSQKQAKPFRVLPRRLSRRVCSRSALWCRPGGGFGGNVPGPAVVAVRTPVTGRLVRDGIVVPELRGESAAVCRTGPEKLGCPRGRLHCDALSHGLVTE